MIAGGMGRRIGIVLLIGLHAERREHLSIEIGNKGSPLGFPSAIIPATT